MINSLYIHIPFCSSICDYCDFTKLQYFRNFAEMYLNSLEKEMNSYNIPQVKTIYVGGGTPTCLDDDLFERLLITINRYNKKVKEYTFECNPESLTISKLNLMKKYGVNRLSIGVESTNNKVLSAIGRKHTYQDVIKCLTLAKNVGFNNLNVDLIIGLPNCLESQLKKDLDNILKLPINHISCYSLTVHENTKFGINGVKEYSDDQIRSLYDLVHLTLLNNGFEHYEISNWCKPGYESKHNLTYWKNEEYYGLGLGASGYVNKTRYTNTKSINKYLNNEFIDYKEIVDPASERDYFIMLNLRTHFGINLIEYKKLFNKDLLQEKKDTLEELINNGLLVYKKDQNSIVPTYEGMMILDHILLKLL